MGVDDGLPCERPRHRVWIDTFLIARTPVTNREYARYLDATGAAPPAFWSKPGFDGPDQPVVGLAWSEAVLFATWTSARLPTEAEWEYAARGGIEGARFPWGDEPIDETRANYALPRAVPNASYPPNGYGLFEMVGNVIEWVHDIYHDQAYQLTPREVVDDPGP